MAEVFTAEQLMESQPQTFSAEELMEQTPQKQVFTAEDLAEPGIVDKAKAAYAEGVKGTILEKPLEGPFPNAEQIRQSPIGKVMAEFNKPMQFTAARAVSMLEQVTPGIKSQLNPANEWIPDTGFHDILNYYTPKPEDVAVFLERNGFEPISKTMLVGAYATTRFGVGLAMNVVGDPLFFMGPKVGQLTSAAESAYKAGNVAAKERNLIALQPPLMKKPILEVPLAPVAKAVTATAERAATAVKKIPGAEEALDFATQKAKVAGDLLASFSPWTRDPEIDLARVQHTVDQSYDARYVENFIKEHATRNYTDEELKILRETIESTPNLMTKGGEIADVSSISEQITKTLSAKNLPQPRIEQMLDTVLSIKKENAKDLLERIKAGIIDQDNLQVIEGYLVHKISEQGQRYLNKNPAMAAAFEEAGLVKRTEQSLNGKTVSTYDAGRYTRKMRTTLDEANAIMREKSKGKVGAFFMEDPILATAQKRAETRKFLRDRELLDTLSTRGVPKDQLRKSGMYWVDKNGKEYLPINHPNFEKKTFIIKTEQGTIKKSLAEMMFPKEIATKVSYDILPRNAGPVIGNVNAFMDSYNRVFRNFALFKPDYYLENWIDNVLKNAVNGVRLESYFDAARLTAYLATQRKALSLGEKFEAGVGRQYLRYAPTKETITVAGKQMPIHEVAEILDRYSVRTGSHFDEGLEKVLFTGKKIAKEQNLAAKGKLAAEKSRDLVGNVFRGMHIVGESGENLTRSAFFIDLLKRGYKPEIAALEVEKFLFNFKRTTANMDVMRRFYNPFVQAAFKTAEIAPQLLARKAYIFNAYENNLMSALQASFNDPVTSWSVQQLYPDYYKMHDRIAGPLLPANHWLLATAGFDVSGKRTELPMAIALGLPGGLGILNQFVAFDYQVFKQAESAPFIRSMVILMTGQDPWTGRDLNLIKNKPDPVRNARMALNSFFAGALALPNAEKYLMQKYGLTNPDFLEPDTVLAIHGMMSKFGKVTNLEKEYFAKLNVLGATHKALTMKLRSEAGREFMGRTADVVLNGSLARDAVNFTSRAYTSAEVVEAMTGGITDVMTLKTAVGQLQGEKPTMQDIVGMLKNVNQTVKELNKNYQVLAETYFKTMKDYRDLEFAEQQIP